MSDMSNFGPPYEEYTAMALDPATIVYALRCAANWLEERGDPSYIDLPDERGEILRWARDNPEVDG